MTWAAIALGGNEGDVARTFHSAVHLLRERGCTPQRFAELFVTRSVGDRSGGDYHNSALTVETSLAPLELLEVLEGIEVALGRVVRGHWMPRPLDLDLVAFGDVVCETPRLTLPHPAAWYRMFVLEPLAQVAEEWIHPHRGLSVQALRDRLRQRPLRVGVAGSTVTERDLWEQAGRPDRSRILFSLPQTPQDLNTQPIDLLAWLGTRSAGPGSATTVTVGVDKTHRPAPDASLADVGSDVGTSRPSGEAGPAEFLAWPADLRLNARLWQSRDPQWLKHLVTGLLDSPQAAGGWWPDTHG